MRSMNDLYNITCPTSWTAQDFVTQPLPKKTGIYPNHWSQPTKFYTTSDIGSFVLPAGRITAIDIPVIGIERYRGPYIQQVSVDTSVTLGTKDKLMSDDMVVSGPVTDCVLTRDTQGYTFTINE